MPLSLLPLSAQKQQRRPSLGIVSCIGAWMLALGALTVTGCDKKKDTPAVVESVPKVEERELFGAESIEEFKERFFAASVERNSQKYLQLHCLEKLPPNLRASITGAVTHGALNVFSFEPVRLEIEPLTTKETEQLVLDEWNIQPTHWIILSAQNPKQFKHWELGQYEGRYYLANRIR